MVFIAGCATMSLMDRIKTALSAFDAFQQRVPALAFPLAVIKRFGDDQGGRQAALITYYAFLSLFPLLLLFMTVLGYVVRSNPDLEGQIVDAALRNFPALGDDLQKNVKTLQVSGLALLAQMLVLLYGARGFASMLQEAFNNLWHVDRKIRPGFVGDNLRSVGMMLALGLGIITSAVLSYVLRIIFDAGLLTSLLAAAVNLVVTFGLFLAVFRLGTSLTIATKRLIPGAVIAGFGTVVVQHFGGFIMAQQLPKLNSSYGSFALTLGLLFWIYLQSQVILYAIEIMAVKAQRDWPKQLIDSDD